MKIIAVANQKGGVGKTTTAVNLSAGLAELGLRTLSIDFDPQGNLSSSLGIPPQPLPPQSASSLYHAMVGDIPLDSLIQSTPYPNLSVIPSDLSLAGCEIDIAREENPSEHLSKLLDPIRHTTTADVILIDCPPSLGILMSNALTAADSIIIPLQCEYFALEGLQKILWVIDQLRQSRGKETPRLEGILLTMYDARTNLSRQVVDQVREHFGSQVFQTVIPRTVRLSEAPSHGKPVLNHDSSSIGAQAYRHLAKELQSRLISPSP